MSRKKAGLTSKISVLGSDTKILVDIIPDEADAAAMFIPSKDTIWIDSRSDSKFADFCHEFFHLLCHRSSVKQTRGWSDDAEEVLAENFAIFMSENFDEVVRIRRALKRKG